MLNTKDRDAEVLVNGNWEFRQIDSSFRCPLCANSSFLDANEDYLICRLCSLAIERGASPNLHLSLFAVPHTDDLYEFPNWNNYEFRLYRRFEKGPPAIFSPETVRSFANREGGCVKELTSSSPLNIRKSISWLYGKTLRARIANWKPECALLERRLTLGVITSVAGRADTFDLCQAMAESVGAIVVALDTDDVSLARSFEQQLEALVAAGSNDIPTRVVARPLQSNFASQRNLVQEMAPTEWVLHLDSDERLTLGTLSRLPEIVADAVYRNLDGVSFPRRNMVDGILAALYPDVQNRLVRQTVRFTRPVHEYPVLRRASFHLGGGIVHQIASARLERRAATFETIMNGASRPYDTAMLLKLLDPTIRLPS